MTPRACVTCQHFYLDPGGPGYSEHTPTEPTIISCTLKQQKGCAWPKYDYYTDVDMPALITRAEKCKLYEVHELLIT